MSRYFKYILLAIFIAAVLIIVFLQFNSNSNINKLIDGNEKLLDELNLKNNLQQLQTGIITLESKVRGTIIGGVAIDSNHLKQEINSINLTLVQLDTLQSDKMIAPFIFQLRQLVKSKIDFNEEILDSFRLQGKIAAERLINKQYGKQLTDTIKSITIQIDDLHQVAVTELINDADNSGRKARTLGTIMALIAAIASIFTFGYVAYKIREQQQLIAKLNASERKAIEAARVKENFLANMSHEIRTPMNAILGFTNLLQRKELDKEAKEHVRTIQKSGENLLTIIDDILDLSKIEAGMMRIESTPFSIRSLVHSIEAMFEPKANEKQLLLSTTVDEAMPDTLEGDATRLTQILINLISNALKFTNKGSISIQIRNEGVAGGIIKTGILVSDTGIGIEKEKLKKIFERFEQAEDAVTRKFGGTGLGLSIINELLMLQQGTIKVDSEPGTGTRFHLQIPYKIAIEQIIPPVTNRSTVINPIDLENIHVLVVDDNEINQSLIRHLFNNWKLGFTIASNGKEAIDLLKKERYDLILMDIQMPEMDGYTATQEIRKHFTPDIPIIAMTAHAMPGEREKCLSYGMNEYLSKPIREQQLYQLIKQFTGLSADTSASKASSLSIPGNYKCINLQYMKEVSRGNIEYEKVVTQQFIESIPEDLDAIEKAWQENDIGQLRKVAHDMKTTVSVMGLDETLRPYLDALESTTLTTATYDKNFSALQSICATALVESKLFYASL